MAGFPVNLAPHRSGPFAHARAADGTDIGTYIVDQVGMVGNLGPRLLDDAPIPIRNIHDRNRTPIVSAGRPSLRWR